MDAGGPAAAAGVLPKDILLEVCGCSVRSGGSEALTAAIALASSRGAVDWRFLRVKDQAAATGAAEGYRRRRTEHFDSLRTEDNSVRAAPPRAATHLLSSSTSSGPRPTTDPPKREDLWAIYMHCPFKMHCPSKMALLVLDLYSD